MMQRLATIALALAASTAFAQEPTGDPSIIPPGAKLEVLFDGAFFSEGTSRGLRWLGLLQRHYLFHGIGDAGRAYLGATIPRPAKLRSSARPAACPTASSSTRWVG